MRTETASLAASVTIDDVRRATAAGHQVIRETPVLSSRTLTERTGVAVALKAENLQRTGSFKLRGALAKIASLSDAECAHGVVGSQREARERTKEEFQLKGEEPRGLC